MAEIFELSLRDDTTRTLDKLERRLRSIENQRAFDVFEKKVDSATAATGKLANDPKKGLNAVGIAGAAAGVAVVAAVTAMIAAFVKLGTVGVRALQAVITEGVQLNQVLETAELTFTKLFDDETLGNAAVVAIKKVSREARISESAGLAFAQSILPRTENLEQFEQLLKLTQVQAQQLGQSVGDLVFPIREALTGDFVSIRDRFDLSRDEIKKMRDLGKEVGETEALVQVLGESFERRGLSLEAFATSGTAGVQTLQASFDELKVILGAPIFEQQKESIREVSRLIEENRPLLVATAEAIGNIVAKLLKVATQLLTTVGESEFLRGVKAFFEVWEEVGLAIEFVTKQLGITSDSVDSVATNLGRMAAGSVALFRELIVLIGKVIGGFNALNAGFVSTFELIQKIRDGEINPLTDDLDTLFKEAIFDAEAFNAELDKTKQNTAEYDQAVKDLREEQKLRGQDAAELNQEEIDGINARLAELNNAADKTEEIETRLNALRSSLVKQFINEQIAASRRLIDQEIALSRRREDMARRNARRLSEIFERAEAARAQALEDNQTDIADFEQEVANDRRELAEDNTDALLDIERNYQRRLRDLQRDFGRTAREAQINNDAIAFLQAKRQLEDSLEDARIARQDSVSDTNRGTQEQAQDLERSIAESRAELDASLQERLAAVDESLQNQLESFAESNRIQEEEFAISQKRQEEDLQKSLARKNEDLVRSLNEQLAEITSKNDMFADVTAQSLIQQAQAYISVYGPDGIATLTMAEFFGRQRAAVGASGATPSSINSRLVNQNLIGQAGLVGEFLTNPVNRVSPPQAGGGGGGGSVTNSSQNLNFNFQGVEPFLQRIAVQAAIEVYRNANRGL